MWHSATPAHLEHVGLLAVQEDGHRDEVAVALDDLRHALVARELLRIRLQVKDHLRARLHALRLVHLKEAHPVSEKRIEVDETKGE